MTSKANVWTVLAAVAASSATAYFVGKSAGPPTSCKDDSARLEAVSRELARLVDVLSERTVPPPKAEAATPTRSAASPISSPAGAASAAGMRDAAGLAPAPRVERDETGLLPRPDVSKAAELGEWDEKEEVRRRWMFLPESRVVATFGTPT